MCHFLYLASPLTLSEVRSMLPAGLAADPLSPLDTRRFQPHLPGQQSVSRLLVGACSCDLILDRDPDHHREESDLRRRYRAMGLNRDAIIHAIDRHRQGTHPGRSARAWQERVEAFVAVHARNAGDTLFYREFSAGGLLGQGLDRQPHLSGLRATRGTQFDWLPENEPVVVHRRTH
jgi:hypothetical protein